MVRVTVTMILTVVAHLCVVLTIVKVDPEVWTVVHLHAIMTQIAHKAENAMP